MKIKRRRDIREKEKEDKYVLYLLLKPLINQDNIAISILRLFDIDFSVN